MRNALYCSTNLASQIDAHTNDSTDGRIHTLRITAAGKYGNAFVFVRATLDESLFGLISFHD